MDFWYGRLTRSLNFIPCSLQGLASKAALGLVNSPVRKKQSFAQNFYPILQQYYVLMTEALLPMGIMRQLSEEEMAEYVAPFKNEGEDRRPTLTFPREIPIEGHPKVSFHPFMTESGVFGG